VSSRRDILTGIAGLASSSSLASAAAPPVDLDLDDPAVNLQAYVKLRGSLDGDRAYDMVLGRVFGLVEGEPARPLFKTAGAGWARYERVSALEYRAVTRYVGLLLDWQTEQPLQQWSNPYNDEVCDIPVTNYGPSDVRVLSDRMLPASLALDELPGNGRPWFVMGDVVHMVDQIVSDTADSRLQPDADLMTYSGGRQQLADPGLASIPSQLSFTAIEDWRDWMLMEQAGSLWWHVSGVKLDGPGSYPAWLRAALAQQAPDFFEEEM